MKNKEQDKHNKIVNINEKRKSNFTIFQNLAEEEKWIERVKKECLHECMEKEKNNG